MKRLLKLKREKRFLRRILSRTKITEALHATWKFNQYFANPEEGVRIENVPDAFLNREGPIYTQISPWQLEQYINCAAISSAYFTYEGYCYRNLNDWNDFADSINAVRKYNETSYDPELDIFKEMARITRLQFEWQTNKVSNRFLYRMVALCSDTAIDEHLSVKYDLEVSNFVICLFAMYAQFSSSFTLLKPYDVSNVGINQKDFDSALEVISCEIFELPRLARGLRGRESYMAYEPSVFRLFPVIQVSPKTYVCPIPDLIIFRLIDGIRYDLADGAGGVRNIISDNFEKYCLDFLSVTFPEFVCFRERKYGTRQQPKCTVDISLREGRAVKYLVECKATTLTHAEKFNQFEADDVPTKIGQLTKAFLQIWRNVRDARAELIADYKVSESAIGIVLTLDDWIQFDRGRYRLLLKGAERLADLEGLERDHRIPIKVMSIDEMEQIATRSDPRMFEEVLVSAQQGEFEDWMVLNVFNHLGSELDNPKLFPYGEKLGKLIPWWENFSQQEG